MTDAQRQTWRAVDQYEVQFGNVNRPEGEDIVVNQNMAMDYTADYSKGKPVTYYTPSHIHIHRTRAVVYLCVALVMIAWAIAILISLGNSEAALGYLVVIIGLVSFLKAITSIKVLELVTRNKLLGINGCQGVPRKN